MVVFDLNFLLSEYNYSDLFMVDKQLDITLYHYHKIRNNAKANRNVVEYEKINEDIDCALTNKDTVKQALMVRERQSVQIFKNRLIGIHYLN